MMQRQQWGLVIVGLMWTLTGFAGGQWQPFVPKPAYQAPTFSMGSRMSPFVVPALEPATLSVQQGGLQPDRLRVKEPLEVYDMGSLHYVGLMQKAGKNWGLVQSGDGRIHWVSVGRYMGQDYGQVASITPASITVIELVRGQKGTWQKRRKVLSAQTE